MFNLFTDAVENTLDIGSNLLDGELPSKNQVAKLVDAGLTVYAISDVTGLAVDVIEDMMEDNI